MVVVVVVVLVVVVVVVVTAAVVLGGGAGSGMVTKTYKNRKANSGQSPAGGNPCYSPTHTHTYIYATPPSRTHALCLNCLGSSSCPYKSLQSPLFLVICEVH